MVHKYQARLFFPQLFHFKFTVFKICCFQIRRGYRPQQHSEKYIWPFRIYVLLYRLCQHFLNVHIDGLYLHFVSHSKTYKKLYT